MQELRKKAKKLFRAEWDYPMSDHAGSGKRKGLSRQKGKAIRWMSHQLGIDRSKFNLDTLNREKIEQVISICEERVRRRQGCGNL